MSVHSTVTINGHINSTNTQKSSIIATGRIISNMGNRQKIPCYASIFPVNSLLLLLSPVKQGNEFVRKFLHYSSGIYC